MGVVNQRREASAVQKEEVMTPKMVKVNGAPGIYKRGGSYVVTFRDPQGRQRERFARTLAEARKLKAANVADVARGEFRQQSAVTFADYAAEWIASYTGRTSSGISEDTRAEYRHRLGLDEDGQPLAGGGGAVGYFGRLRLADIGPRDLRRYAAHVAARGLARDTVRLALAPVKAMLATAAEDELIRSNPAAGLRNLIPANESEAEGEQVKALTEDELRALLAALPERVGLSTPRLFCEFLAQTGLRFGEAVEVRWSDIEGRRLHVQRRYRKGRVGLPKGRKTRRVPLTGGMRRALWALPHAPKPGGAFDELVFVSERRELPALASGSGFTPSGFMRDAAVPQRPERQASAEVPRTLGPWFHASYLRPLARRRPRLARLHGGHDERGWATNGQQDRPRSAEKRN